MASLFRKEQILLNNSSIVNPTIYQHLRFYMEPDTILNGAKPKGHISREIKINKHGKINDCKWLQQEQDN